MTVHDWLLLATQQIKETDLLTWLAVGLGVTEVLLARSNKIWLYPAGIGSTVLSAWILLQAGLYAESLLNLYYLLMSVYGWWYWKKKKNQPPVKVSYASRRDRWVALGITIASFFILYAILKFLTDSTVPAWDAWVSATAWGGMWLLSKRKIENWILLNISNLFAIPLLIDKKLPLFAALTSFLFLVAIPGYFEWKKIIREQNPGNPNDQPSI